MGLVIRLLSFPLKKVKHCPHLNLKGATAAMLTCPGSLARRGMLNVWKEDLWLLLDTSALYPRSPWLETLAEETPGSSFPFALLLWSRRLLPWPVLYKVSSSVALSTLLRRYFPNVQFWFTFRLSWRSLKAFWVSALVRRSSVSFERGASLFGICGLL